MLTWLIPAFAYQGQHHLDTEMPAMSTLTPSMQKSCFAEGHLSGIQVLVATAITGVAQAMIGGQPLLIVGVAEPIVLIYSFMYQFAKGKLCLFGSHD